MNFEGTQVNIPIKGIMRAGTTNVAPDGAMNEVVGMEFKDGSWLPYKEHEEEWTVYLQNRHGTYNVLTGIKDVFTHKTSDDGEHLVFLAGPDNMLAYEINREVEYKHIYCRRLISEGVKDVSFVGNILCAATGEGIKNYIWKNNGYEERNHAEYPKVELRTTLGLKSDLSDNRIGVVYCQKLLGAKLTDVSKPSDTQINSIANAGVMAVLGETRDRGGLTGYVLACVAYRLKNGDLVQATAPILLGRPAIKNGKKEYNLRSDDGTFDNEDKERGVDTYAIYERFWKPFDVDRDETKLRKDGFNEIERRMPTGTSTEKSCVVVGDPSPFSPDNRIVMCKRFGVNGLTVPNNESQWQSWQTRYGEFSYTGETYTWYPLAPTAMCAVTYDCDWYQGYFRIDTYFNSIAICDKLQYRIKELPAGLLTSEIQSVCVFISPEISPYYFDQNGEDAGNFIPSAAAPQFHKGMMMMTDEGSGSPDKIFSVSSMFAKYRTNDEIIRDIKKITTLYLVEEVSVTELSESDDWIDIDLKGNLGDNLLTHEQLPLTAYPQGTSMPEWLDAYNYRLHQYDYKQQLFKGYALPEMYHHGGQFQYPAVEGESTDIKWEIQVDIEDEDGNRSVVNYAVGDAGEVLNTVNPVLSYPSIYAKKMTIRAYETSGNTLYVKESEFTLIPVTSLGMACYIDTDLKPFEVFDESAEEYTGEFPSMSPSDDIRSFRNGMKASDVAYPTYFPAKYTYRFGNERIIGLARLTIPMAQDSFGRYQLIVFCTDGIYSLDVDASGNGVYNSQAFVSPEVCVNRNSICEIGGAVFFAGDKGLMVLTGDNNVQMYEPMHNGMPDFLPATTQSKEAHGIYKKMIDSTQILSKTGDTFADSISTTDFVDFIKHEDTHLIYISNKNKLLAYNKNKDYSYFIDIQTHNMTKIAMSAFGDDGDIIGKTIWEAGQSTYTVHTMSYLSEPNSNDIPCLVQSRPIKVQQDDKCSYRVVLTGYFEGILDNYADLIVLGSLDGEHWRVIGVKEKKLIGGFHNIGCLTERGSWKYLMFIFGGKLSNASHIDSVDITVDGRYNNKKR